MTTTLTFEKLARHVGHQIAAEARGLPAQNVVLICTECGEVLLDLDADGESAMGLVPVEPGPEQPPDAEELALALPIAA
ncbi:MAG: hypothetical protein HGA45_21545 [Chloroflexales bacterium]|nr:hypothetical protein [Chloroflexales bacterium]